MINLRILFGRVPKTAEYEARQEALRKEYNELTAFSQSKELAEYLELEKTVLSSEFILKKKNIAGATIFGYSRIQKGKGIPDPEKATGI